MHKLLILFSFLLSTVAFADNPTPYDLNVYSLGNIGTAANPYGSDFQGAAGAGGNAYLNGFSGNLVGPSFPYSFYTGGSFNLNSGSISNGGVEAGGSVNLNSATISGNVSSGGSLQGGFGTVTGNATVQGSNTSNLTVNGTVTTGHTYTPSVSLSGISQYFQSASTFWGGLSATATAQNVFGQLQVSNLVSGRNVVNLTLAQLAGAYGIALNGPSDAFVIFNITDATPTQTLLHDVTFSLTGGIQNNDILFNLTNATDLLLSGGDYLSILAPNANVSFPSGLVTGNLVVGNLLGSGQVDTGAFTGYAADQINFVAAPEPSSYLLLSSFVGLCMLLRRKQLRSFVK